MMRDLIVIGSRGSRLSLWQAEKVASSLKKETRAEVRIKKIKTKGDKILDSPLSKIGGKGLFVKELEVALEKGEIDLAIHSMKDLPTEIPSSLTLAATLKRDDYRDAFISRENLGLKDLPLGATLGTSSLRRKAQLLAFRPDFKVVDVRGNVETRLRKLQEGQLEGIVLSAAGLDRLGLALKITERISPEICLSAVGQGVIAVEARQDDLEMLKLLETMNHPETRVSALAERALMKELEGGCQVPIGALGESKNGELKLTAIVASLDGQRLVKDFIEGDSSQAEELGKQLAKRLLGKGAAEILAEIRSRAGMSLEG